MRENEGIVHQFHDRNWQVSFESIHNTKSMRYFICNFRCVRIPINVFIYCDSQQIKRCSSSYICCGNYQIWYFVGGDNSLIIMENHGFSFWTFRDNLLMTSQSEILHNSKLIKAPTKLMSLLPPWVNEHKGLVIVVSSAYKMNSRLAHTLWISLIYIMKRRGPNIETWGTPVSITRVEDAVPSNSKYWRRCVR